MGLTNSEPTHPNHHTVTVIGGKFAVDGDRVAVGYVNHGQFRFGCHTLTAEAAEKLRKLLNTTEA
jgi:hypothetical protein